MALEVFLYPLDYPDGITGTTQLCVKHYLVGLKEAGWSADPRMITFSVLTAIFYRYFFGFLFGEFWPTKVEELKLAIEEASSGGPNPDPFFDSLAAFMPNNIRLYQQINQLLKEIS